MAFFEGCYKFLGSFLVGMKMSRYWGRKRRRRSGVRTWGCSVLGPTLRTASAASETSEDPVLRRDRLVRRWGSRVGAKREVEVGKETWVGTWCWRTKKNWSRRCKDYLTKKLQRRNGPKLPFRDFQVFVRSTMSNHHQWCTKALV